MRRQADWLGRGLAMAGKGHKTKKQVIIRGTFPITGQEGSWRTEKKKKTKTIKNKKKLYSRHFVNLFLP